MDFIFCFFLSPLFDFSNLHNWSLLHERYLPIRHKTGTSSAHPDLREHGVCVRNIAFGESASTCDCLVQTSNYNNHGVAERCSGLTN